MDERRAPGPARAVDPYGVLGVDAGAAHEEIHRAWVAQARRHHPDHGGDPARMQAVNEAWALLADPARRRAWDREHGGVGGAGPAGAHGQTTDDHRDDDDLPVDDDLGVDLLDARPLVEAHRSPFDLAPVALFALAILVGCLGLALDAPVMLGLALFVFFLSCLAVVAAAMLSMRRSVRAGRR